MAFREYVQEIGVWGSVAIAAIAVACCFRRTSHETVHRKPNPYLTRGPEEQDAHDRANASYDKLCETIDRMGGTSFPRRGLEKPSPKA